MRTRHIIAAVAVVCAAAPALAQPPRSATPTGAAQPAGQSRPQPGTQRGEAQPEAPKGEGAGQAGIEMGQAGARAGDAAARASDAAARASAAGVSDADAAAAFVHMRATREELPPIEEEVRGTCQTPRQAWLQLLWWLQKDQGRWRPDEAARCFDLSSLQDADTEGPRRAAMLKETIDSRRLWIKVDRLPTNPDYQDNESGYHIFYEPAVSNAFGRAIYLERRGDQWLFSDETVDKIPDIYPVTGFIERYVPAWLKTTIGGVEAWKYLLLVVIYLIARMVKWLLLFVLSQYVRRLMQRTQHRYLERMVQRAENPISILVMALVFHVSVPFLLLPIRFTEVVQIVVEAMAAYAGVWLAYRLIDVLTDYMMERASKTEGKLDDQLVPLISKTLKVFVSVVGGLFILQNLDVNIGSLLAGVGLGGLAFALAAKDTIANFFGSVMIFIDKPFQIGDWVVINNTEGVIEEVGFRTSRVRTFYNSLVTVPNALVTNAVVDNYGARKYRRYVANLRITHDTPPEKVQAFCEGIRAIIVGMPSMRKDYYIVEFKEFGDSSLVIMVYCFMAVGNWNDEMRSRTILNLEMLRLAKNLGVSFAFPTQTLHVSTLPHAGESLPSHFGPDKPEELARVVEAFGPQGSLAKPEGLVISQTYDCRTLPVRSTQGGDG